jgi:hypothetical protein
LPDSDANKQTLLEELLAIGSHPMRKKPKPSPMSLVDTNPTPVVPVPADRGSDNGDNAPDSIDDSASETTGIMP